MEQYKVYRQSQHAKQYIDTVLATSTFEAIYAVASMQNYPIALLYAELAHEAHCVSWYSRNYPDVQCTKIVYSQSRALELCEELEKRGYPYISAEKL